MQPSIFGQILVQVLIAAQLPHDVSSHGSLGQTPAIQAATPPSRGRPATSKDLQLGHLTQDVAELSVGHAWKRLQRTLMESVTFPCPSIQRIYILIFSRVRRAIEPFQGGDGIGQVDLHRIPHVEVETVLHGGSTR